MKKNITRRLTTALLAAVMCVSMAACGSKTDDTKTDGTGAADGAKKYTIGVCQLVTHDALDAATQGFIDAVKDKLGEENVTIDVQNAANDQNVCTTIVNTFVSKKVDLIMANATPALQAAYNATAEIPILGTSVTEYGVALGIDNFSGTVDERVALDRLTTKVGTLSGGQRQALTLLMATLQKPKLLLLDEHTAALDPQTAQRVMDITDRLVRENHLTTLMITHNMRDAIHYGNRLLMLHNGRIVLDTSGEEKARLTVPDLLALFSKVSGQEYDNDRALLA